MYIDLVRLADADNTIEDRLPVFVAREIVVGNEEAADAFRPMALDKLLDVVSAFLEAQPAVAPGDAEAVGTFAGCGGSEELISVSLGMVPRRLRVAAARSCRRGAGQGGRIPVSVILDGT
jgi:hypothetical protein